jgi:hypothetical protein
MYVQKENILLSLVQQLLASICPMLLNVVRGTYSFAVLKTHVA